MTVVIAGCRHISGQRGGSLVAEAIDKSGWSGEIDKVLHGGAPGIDSAVHAVCSPLWPVVVFPAEWHVHGRAAGPVRNELMARSADALIAIWDGKSRGTASMINAAKKHGLKIFVLEVDA